MNLLRFVGIFAKPTKFGGFIIITLFIIVSSLHRPSVQMDRIHQKQLISFFSDNMFDKVRD